MNHQWALQQGPDMIKVVPKRQRELQEILYGKALRAVTVSFGEVTNWRFVHDTETGNNNFRNPQPTIGKF